MTNKSYIPDLETRSKNVTQWREACRKLDLVTLKFDELIAIIEADLRQQKLEKLQNTNKSER
ncbi:MULTISPECIES: hypothetical protein [Crocosphaera]|uniref:Uncharacterized protein n=5 Tax=Crocosphaera watsonii TaxID=263511 RepID=T2JW61_CROWT|nr:MULTISPECIES: hypothetical protein [Crocosphaera]EHJ12829.1 hypothetical protein CWATWH0003_2469 [Crocosphaera watsonii WH 0003]MCH2243840.1 hypothetical protein [Crocosphaera sp.]NQZ64839.1 hypothetical protein [Crocosphaera sp.]CCQ53455.1 hypothetical protein CWATWH8502_3689 [Crocosphaera watsonii WH 8502]CCQ58885.1 hypothetical protein CWATWH0005_4482 [Crocosphaera watsonii WH 0005]